MHPEPDLATDPAAAPDPAASGPPALQLCALTRTHGDGPRSVDALAGLDLDFARGSFTAVMGPSGSGKSTLLACAAGLDEPTSGRVVLEGHDLAGLDEDARTRLRLERIGFVFQAFHLMPYLTAEQNVALPLRLAGRRPDRQQVRTLLAAVGLEGREEHLPGDLSGGQQQRVALARALVTRPAVLLADEPTGALDTRTAQQVLALLRRAVDESGQTIVLVTHDPSAAAHADDVVFLVDGRLVGRMHRPTADDVAGRLAHLDRAVA